MWTKLPVLALLAVLGPAAAQKSPAPRFADPDRRAKLAAAFSEIEKAFENFRQRRGIPGLSYGIVIDGETVIMKSFGVRERESQDLVTPDTVFRIASMTKSFTGMALLKLRDEGKLSLDDPVAKWIPEFTRMPYPTRDTAPVRVRQLVTHGVGLPEDNPWGDRQLGVSEDTMTRWLAQGLPFSTPPDTAYEYSNYGFALAGRVIAKASGMTYRDYVEKRILAPLGMKASTLEPGAVPEKVRAMGYRRAGDNYSEEPSLPHGAFGAMGGLLTSTRDLARYAAFLLSAYPPRDDEDSGPVRRSSLREMQREWRSGTFRVSRPLQVTAGGYGYGLAVTEDCRYGHIVGHGGGLPGFGSYMKWLPEYGVGIVAMANLTYSSPAPAIEEAYELLRKTGALKPRVLPPSEYLLSAREAIVKLWQRWDDAEAAALAADNLFLDTPAAERRQAFEKLKSEVGGCRPAGDIEPENWLRGRFRMDCERGAVEVVFTLAPTMPPKVQALRFSIARPPAETSTGRCPE